MNEQKKILPLHLQDFKSEVGKKPEDGQPSRRILVSVTPPFDPKRVRFFSGLSPLLVRFFTPCHF